MSDQMIIELLAFLGAVLLVVKPIITASNTMTALKTTMETLIESVKSLQATLSGHTSEINDLKLQVNNHETRIKELEEDEA